jgi:hypothetical protein
LRVFFGPGGGEVDLRVNLGRPNSS